MAGAIKAFTTSSKSPMTDVAQLSVAGLTVDTTQGNCDILDIRNIRSLAVKPSAGITSLTFYGCATNNGTFVLINDLGTNGAVTVVASVWNVITATALVPHAFIQMKPNTNGTADVVAKN